MMFEQLQPLVPELIGIISVVLASVAAYFGAKNSEVRKSALKLETEIRRRLRNEVDLPLPAQTKLSNEEVETKVQELINKEDAEIDMATFDGTYFAPSPEDKDILRVAGTVLSKLPYRPERFDCENYAFAYKTITAFVLGVNSVAVVVDWSSTHAYSLIVYDDGSHELYDPQLDEFVEPGDTIGGVEHNFDRADIYL